MIFLNVNLILLVLYHFHPLSERLTCFLRPLTLKNILLELEIFALLPWFNDKLLAKSRQLRLHPSLPVPILTILKLMLPHTWETNGKEAEKGADETHSIIVDSELAR